MILYFGNKLSKHGVNPTTVETLSQKLSDKFHILTFSDKKNKIYRFFDMLFGLIKNHDSAKLVLIDTYSSLNFFYAFAISQICRLLDIKYIPILHGGNLPLKLVKNRRMSNMIFANAYINVAPSFFLFDEFTKSGFRVKHIPNCINIDDYPIIEKTYDYPRLIYVRAFAEIYNPLMAARVLKKLVELDSRSRLYMVGPIKDNSYKEFSNYIKKQNLQDNIEVYGILTRQEWVRQSAKCNIFINTTNFDNTPVSIIEAMALGFPIVSTNVGGIPYMISNNINGMLCNPNDDNEMADSVIKIINNYELQSKMKENAIDSAKAYSWARVEQQWLELLEAVAK
ncbi:glycosyltransferase family 4 protein [Aeromonas sp. QDB63]|uniref:glycosyltransferase family 4 protein n=1 Tax=Aeromonas sp. QDB63 TaxID=2989825 RepID=UPI0022E02877|nr:glycosyltransferase [Aeromonas sp. QDB63]